MTKEYTYPERQMFVRQLKRARPLIEDDCEKFVCFAISNGNPYEITFVIRDIIQTRLGAGNTATGWLENNHPDVLNEIEEFHSMKEYRLAWIDNMIEEFSK
jgi:hypothetical protein